MIAVCSCMFFDRKEAKRQTTSLCESSNNVIVDDRSGFSTACF